MSYRQQSKRAAFAHRARQERRSHHVRATLTVRLPPSVDALKRHAEKVFEYDRADLVQLPDGRCVPVSVAMAMQFEAMRARTPT